MADVSLQSILDEARRTLDSGDAAQALAIARHILHYAPDVVEGHRLLGEAYLNAGQPEEAVTAFEAVLRADPESVAAYYGLGLAQQSLDRRPEAIRAFERALEIQPNLGDLRTQLLRLYSETPGSAGQFRLSRAGLGRLYMRGQMFGQAIDEFHAVLRNEPDRNDVRVALAETLWRDGQADDAADWSRDALSRQPELLKPALILGYLQVAAQQPEGEDLWRRAVRQEPTLRTAQGLFDPLPPVGIEEIRIPAFDERAWRDEQDRVASETTPEPALATVAAENGDFFGDSWLGMDSPEALVPSPHVRTQPQHEEHLSDEDLLASLLGFDDQDGENDDLSDVPWAESPAFEKTNDPVTASEPIEELASHRAELDGERTAGNAEPFSSERKDESERVQHGARSYDVPAEVKPPASKQEHDNSLVQPYNLQDIDDDAQPFSLDDHASSTEDRSNFGSVEPFSLEDWNLQGGDKPSDNAAPQADTATAAHDSAGTFTVTRDAIDEDHSAFLAGPSEEHVDEARGAGAEQPAGAQAQDVADQPGSDDFKPFSLHDLGLDDEEAVESRDGHPFSPRDLGLEDQAWSFEQNTGHQRETAGYSSLEDAGQSEHSEPADTGKDDDAPAVQPAHDIESHPVAEEVRTEAQAAEAEPEGEPFSFAGLGLSEDELSDMEPAESTEATAAEPAASSELAPFSFADLGLSEEDFADLDLGEPDGANASIQDVAQANGVEQPATTDVQRDTADQEEMRPFSLADLGLTDEELAELGFDTAVPQTDEPAVPGTMIAAAHEEERPPFSFAIPDLTDAELELFGLAGQQAYASSATSHPAAPAPSAEAEQETTGGEPDRQVAVHELPPAEASTTQKPFSFDDFDLGAYEQGAFEEGHALPAGDQPAETPLPGAPPVSTELSHIYEQLEAQPDNHALRLAIARMSEQKGDIERAIDQYRQLIKRNALLDPVIEDLQDLAAGEHDHALLRRVHRLLGDAYIKQDRFQEALVQYSWI